MKPKNSYHFTGVERMRFAVEDLEAATRFAGDWGLSPVETDNNGSLLYASMDGSEVEVAEVNNSETDRTPVGGGSGVCEITWGVRNNACLLALAEELGSDRKADIDDAGVLHSVDDLGIPLAFRVARRREAPYDETKFNAPGHPNRLNRRATRYSKATPHEISHIAIGVDDAGNASKFYTDRLGFYISDRYANRGIFMRCSPQGNHHHLFLMNAKVPGTRFNHLAFKVRDIHEVIGGGQYMDSRGWQTFAGPGRHHVSSACFWYFTSPFGGAWEYAADEDMVTEEWEAIDFAAEAHIFSEWTFGLEKSDGTLRGPIAHSKEQEL